MIKAASIRRLGWLITVSTCLHVRAPAQHLQPQHVQERWAADRGFPGGTVQAIAQTSDGYLWIGTEGGLTQFDGQVFRGVHPSDPIAQTLAPILGMLSDDDGGVWLRLSGPKVLRYSQGKFEDALWSLRPGEDGVTAMCHGKDRTVLLAGVVNGILRYRQGQFVGKVPIRTAFRSAVTAIAEDSEGTLWLGTQHGVSYVKNGQVTTLVGLRSATITSLVLAGEKDVWIGTDRGLFRWDGRAITSDGVPQALQSAPILAMISDHAMNLWIGTGSGLYQFGKSSGQAIFDVVQHVSGSSAALFEDQQGNIWAGLAGAIQRMKPSKFSRLGREAGLRSEGIGPVYVDPANRVWFGLAGGGLYRLDRTVARAVTEGGLSDDTVYAITGRGPDVWIGRKGGGLTHLHLAGGRVAASETFTSTNGLADNAVFAVLAASDGSVWAGALNGGVSRLKDRSFVTYTMSNDGLPSNSVSSIVETAAGTILLGTPKGLGAWSQDHWHTYTPTEGSSAEITSLLSDPAGYVWAGTPAGVAVFDGHSLRRPPKVPPQMREPILGIAEDRQRFLWFVTPSNVMRASAEKLRAGTLTPADVRTIDANDGLPGLEGIRRDRPLAVDMDGRIWIATGRGLATVDPAQLGRSSEGTRSRIEGLAADGSAIPGLERARVPPGSRRVVFSYSGINLSASSNLRFRYRLDPFDRDWSEPTAAREAVYANLPPGAYRFRVLATTGAAAWQEATEAGLALTVDPMFWQTSWFLTLLTVATLGTALAGYRIHLRRISQQLSVRFEERLGERTRIARELHDTLLQSLHGLMFRFQAARNMLPGRAEDAANALDGAIVRAEQAIIESRNAIQHLRSQASANDDLAQSLMAIVKDLSPRDAGAGSASFRVIIEGEPRPLAPLLQEEVFPIARELLQNAVQHSRAHEIEAEIRYDRERFRLRIRDDGTGIDQTVLAEGGLAGHWGLPGTKERAHRIGGHLDFWSEAGAGTEVELTVPAAIAYKIWRQRSGFGWLRKTKDHGDAS